MITIYGIKNCNTMKKAMTWLDEHHIDYQFYNYKTAGLTSQQLQPLLDLLGWKILLNTKGTTWRKLDESIRQAVTNEAAAKQLMLDNPSIIKRPIIVNDTLAPNQSALAGFSPEQYQHFFEN